MNAGSYIVWGVGITALVFGGRYLIRLNRLSNELEAVTKVSIYKVSLTGLDLRIEVTLKNPSAGSVKVKHPFVKIMHFDTTIASSTVKDRDIEIPKYSEVKLEPIILNLGFLSLASSAPNLLKEYREARVLSLTVKTITTINNSIPFTKSDVVKINGGLLS